MMYYDSTVCFVEFLKCRNITIFATIIYIIPHFITSTVLLNLFQV